MRLKTIRVHEWPVLGWLAVCPASSDDVTAYIGDHVETCDEWVCEAVWDGSYADGGFDETDIVFGTGVRDPPRSGGVRPVGRTDRTVERDADR